jgi:hypothetical protein
MRLSCTSVSLPSDSWEQRGLRAGQQCSGNGTADARYFLSGADFPKGTAPESCGAAADEGSNRAMLNPPTCCALDQCT